MNDLVAVPLTQGQFDALTMFTFNEGRTAFGLSTLRADINAGKLDDVPRQLRRWVFAGGRWLQGLVNRREKEIELWES